MVLFINSFIDAVNISRAKYNQYLFPIGMDVLFFILYGAIMGGIFKKAMFYLIQAGYTAIQIHKENQLNTSLFDLLLSHPETRILLFKICFLLFMTIALIFFAYSLTQGVAWAKTRNILQKTKTKKYLHKFCRINLVWFIIFIFYKFVLVTVRVKDVILKIENKPIGEYIFLFIFLYFVFISYTLIKEEVSILKTLKETLRIGITKAHSFIPVWITFLILLTIIHYLLIFITKFSPIISLIISIIILLPALTFGRLYILIGVKKVEG